MTQPTLAPPDPVLVKKVEEVVLRHVREAETAAKASTSDLWNRIKRCDEIYSGGKRDRKRAGSGDMQKLGAEFRVPEAANQIDLVSALFRENISQNNKDFRVVPIGNERYARALTTQLVMNSELAYKHFDNELGLALFRYVKHPLAGLKTCIDYTPKVEMRRAEIPASDPDILAAVAAGMQIIGPGDVGEDGTYSTMLVESKDEKSKFNYYIRCMDMLRTSFSDFTRGVTDQHSIHEYHYWTMPEIERAGSFRNLDKIKSSGSTDRRYPDGGVSTNNATFDTTTIHVHEIVESWMELPWRKWIETNAVSPVALVEFCKFYDIQVDEILHPDPTGQYAVAVQQKWCVFSTEGSIHKVYPTYLLDKLAFPHHVASYFPGDGELAGESFSERVAPTSALNEEFANMLADNCRMRGYSSIISGSGSELTKEKFQQLQQKFGFVQLENNLPIQDQLKFFAEVIPDLGPTLLNGMAWSQNANQQYGMPAVMQGTSSSGTATESSLNNTRGQQRMNEPFRRFVYSVFVPALEQLRDLIFANFNEGRWVEIAGEEGTLMGNSAWVSPNQITNRFKIEPVATFDFQNRAARGQQLIGLLNIMSRNPAAQEVVVRLTRMALERMDFPLAEINEVMGTAGKDTDPEQELKTMLYNPDEEITVRPEDNHALCLQMAFMFGQNFPQLQGQKNFEKYVFLHQQLFAAQMQQVMAQQAQQQQNGPPGKRGPQPPGDVQDTPEADARQSAQIESAPDQGPQTSAGITGQAAV